jgi:signal transduction histidine kinase
MAVQIAAVVAFLVLAALRKRLPFEVMAGALFILIPVNAAVALLTFGLIGQGTLMILVWATVVAIFSGLRWGLAAATVGIAAFAAVGMAMTRGWLTCDIDLNAYSVATSSWVNAVLGCAFWSLLTAGCVGRSHSELVGALRSSEQRAVELGTLNRRLRELASRLAEAEDAERQRLASVLHDGVGQKLYAAKLRLGVLSVAESTERSAADVEEVMRLVDEAIDHSRMLTLELSPQILHETGLAAALEWLADEHGQVHGTQVEFENRVAAFEAPGAVALAAFQAVRELLHNAAKHAQASEVRVILDRRGHELEVTVADDGVGFLPESVEAEPRQPRGFGLFSISERLEHVGGRLVIRSRVGGGTTAVITVPAQPSEGGP